MFKRTLALAVATALLGLGPVAAGASTHHHHMKKHHMMSSSSMSSSPRTSHKMQCRDKKTGRYMKCAKTM
ncbi:MAG: hypothetical protein M3R44_06915 [Candidatus Eremiobacteraeota bacterium]|nr:hypothetical protein [Candidatus Eremiobacteraeota bacterium]